MTDSMIERVARAIWFSRVDSLGWPNGMPTWDEMAETSFEKVSCRIDAKFAIQAMREPTEAMMNAYYRLEIKEDAHGLISMDAWQVMIDEALKE